MGDRQNYYILLGLDPSIRDNASIEKAIKDKNLQWSTECNHPPPKGVQAKQNIEKLPDIRAVLLGDPQLRKEEAEAAESILFDQKKEKYEKLHELAFIMVEDGKISGDQLSRMVKDTGLPEAEILKELHITVKEEEILSYKDDGIAPLESSIANNILNGLNIVKKKDLFDFLDLSQTSSCRTLLEKAEKIYKETHGTDAVPTAKRSLIGFCRDLFKDENAKSKYQKTLRLEKFKEIYNWVDHAASDKVIDGKEYQKIMSACADKGIEIDEAEYRIQEYCKKKKFALIRPENAEFKKQIQCGICGHLNDKVDGNCAHCGNPLKIKCPKCGKEAASSAKACSGCGFSIGDMPNARPLIRDAKIELGKKNFDQVRDLLAEAEAFNPKHPEIEKIKTELKRETGAIMFDKHYAAAEQALRKGDFGSAMSFLTQAQLADTDKKGKIDELAARINAEEKLSKAQTAFENAKKLSPSKQADECVAILQYCADFKPAIAYLQATKPESCKSITTSTDSSSGCASISWPRSSEQGISYRLVRKQGKVIPVNELDGEVLVKETSETSYRDTTILSGYDYSYAVFAIRCGVFSSAVGKTILLLADVTDARVEQVGSLIRLSWGNPKNCLGVTVRRIQNGVETVLTGNAQSSFEDKDIKYGVTYSYKLCANYNNQAVSRGVDLPPITPSPKIDSFTIKVVEKQGKEKGYKVSWDIRTSGIELQILVNTQTVHRLKSDQGSCDLELPSGGFYTITALALSGGKWMGNDNSEPIEINTYSPCSIDQKASAYYEDSGLQIKVYGVIPSTVTGFYLAVRTGDPQKRWPKIQDIEGASDINRISIASYQQNGEMLYEKMAREENAYYVSLFTIYNMGGKEIISNPVTRRFERPLFVNGSWKLSKNLLGGVKLSLEFSGNRPFERIPEMVLCAGERQLLSHDDANGERLFAIPSLELGSAQKTWKNTYEIKTDLSARQLKDKKFFLFEVSPVPGEKFTLRWAEGFTGKL
jgi:hypothetical protein